MKSNAAARGPASTFAAEMDAFDRLPPAFQAFVRHANQQWACVPMLRRASRCGRNAYGTQGRLLQRYRDEDRAR